ncbi:transcription factor bHLH157-like isoform X2 [Nicotiana sylvestris]|uniref:Transcription factor bHLH155-like isoform X2 n=1 Tax=Nicotiana sylvestris TaxID=4096 RepID=A0A1U7WHQ4_NICSY|nr:PREDICTED: transcription factor bHLH155-like isoform X2 [Nicotiana sylvestris]
MCERKFDSMAKESLKILCRSHGWSYGVFWGFDQRNSLLLTLQDAYYEEQMGAVIDEMLLQVHILGAGIIGKTAFTKKHKWMFSDANNGKQISIGSSNNSNLFQDDVEFEQQFSTGIKTIAVISVEPLGVLQFGSTSKLPERTGFVEQARKLFLGIEVEAGKFPSQLTPSSSSGEICGLLGGSSNSSIWENLHFVNSNVPPTANDETFMKESCLLEELIADDQIMTSDAATSSLSENQLQNVQFNSCSGQFDTQLQQPMFQSAGLFTSFQDSCLTSTWEDLTSNMSIQDFDYVLSSEPNNFEYCADATQSFHESTAFSSLGGFEVFANGDKTTEQYCTLLINQRNDGAVSTINDNLFDTMGIISASGNLSEQHNLNVDCDASVSIQSSITNAFNHVEKGNCSNMSPFEKMTGLNTDVSGQYPDYSTSNRGWNSSQANELRSRPDNRLFSKLGIDQLLDDALNGSCSFAGSVSNDQLSVTNKRRRIGSSSGCNYLAMPPRFSNFDKITKLPECSLDRAISNLEAKSEVITKLDASTLIGDRCSINACNTILPVKGNQKSSKPTKKKAKPGTRPIPKDRQLIYERLSELRELIPNGEKMSIDRLLHRTIKHLLFLQGVTKHAEGLKKTEDLKDAKIRLEKSKTNNGNGVTWACEIGDQTMVCPLIVEDLSTPGQMLIEILCKEQGFFLEMVDIIRGFGLNILKGVIESRETKMWAHFVVEAEGNRLVTRHEIFSSLVQLLHLTSTSEVGLNNQLQNITGGRTALINDCPKSAVPISGNLPETIRCVI